MKLKFCKKQKVMTDQQRKINQAFTDLESWMKTLKTQLETTGTLDEKQLKRLIEVRDTAKRIDPPIIETPNPYDLPPKVSPYEMGYAELFARIDKRKNEMELIHKVTYDKIKQRWEECGRTGVNLGHNDIAFLRGQFMSMFYRV
jgi:hypothetical protein